MGTSQDTEPMPSPPLVSPHLRRQRSMASAIALRCCSALCCFECDNFFTRLPASSSSRDFTIPTSQQEVQQSVAWHDSWRLLGSRRKAIVSEQGIHSEAESVLIDDLYAKPARWRLFLRKLRAGTRKINYSKRSSAGFHYDALSYAMNFDDGCCSWQQQQQQQSGYRASSPAFMETLPTSKVSVSSAP